jgi:pSer/pThr/pTyr-binding forkhead associated (FHA) protein
VTRLHLQPVSPVISARDVVLDRGPCVVGRQEDCDVRLDGAFVSRRHCCFFEDRGEVYINDLESRYGTFVNGERLTRSRALHEGDEVCLGPIRFRVTGCTQAGRRP